MEKNQLTPDEQDLLNVYANTPIEDLTYTELANFRYLLDKHQLPGKVQCLRN